MSQVLEFSHFLEAEPPARPVPDAPREDDAFWPDVASRPLADDAPVDPENTSKRVLFEAFFVLAAAIGAVAAVSLLVPGLS